MTSVVSAFAVGWVGSLAPLELPQSGGWLVQRSLAHESVGLGDLVQQVAKTAQVPLRTDPRYAHRRVTIVAKSRPVHEVLTQLAKAMDLEWRLTEDGTYLLTQYDAIREKEEHFFRTQRGRGQELLQNLAAAESLGEMQFNSANVVDSKTQVGHPRDWPKSPLAEQASMVASYGMAYQLREHALKSGGIRLPEQALLNPDRFDWLTERKPKDLSCAVWVSADPFLREFTVELHLKAHDFSVSGEYWQAGLNPEPYLPEFGVWTTPALARVEWPDAARNAGREGLALMELAKAKNRSLVAENVSGVVSSLAPSDPSSPDQPEVVAHGEWLIARNSHAYWMRDYAFPAELEDQLMKAKDGELLEVMARWGREVHPRTWGAYQTYAIQPRVSFIEANGRSSVRRMAVLAAALPESVRKGLAAGKAYTLRHHPEVVTSLSNLQVVSPVLFHQLSPIIWKEDGELRDTTIRLHQGEFEAVSTLELELRSGNTGTSVRLSLRR